LALARPLTEADVIAERCGVRPLAVTSAGETVDWLQLSRRHVVEADHERMHTSIFGGKLTDCLNVGDEVCALVQSMGIRLSDPGRRWYGEPGEELHQEFLLQAERMGLDARTSPRSSEPLSVRLWRRYGAEAFTLLESIRRDPRMVDLLIEGAEYLRCEIELAARREMVTRLEDFLRRRSKIALVARREDLARAPGLREACRILFGDAAQARYDEYFGIPT